MLPVKFNMQRSDLAQHAKIIMQSPFPRSLALCDPDGHPGRQNITLPKGTMQRLLSVAVTHWSHIGDHGCHEIA